MCVGLICFWTCFFLVFLLLPWFMCFSAEAGVFSTNDTCYDFDIP